MPINIMMNENKPIPTTADLIKDPQNREKTSLKKTRGITADMVAEAEAMFKQNPVVISKLSSTNHRKKSDDLPPSNYIG